MDPSPPTSERTARVKTASMRKRAAMVAATTAVIYLLVAYLLAPFMWSRYDRRHPWLADAPDVTHTKDGHPGDPLNVALLGDEGDVRSIMEAAGWYPANPLGIRSDVRIAADTVLERPYDEAPVSNLYLFGRKQDLAFERPVGDDPRRRHHVRYWKCEKQEDGRPVWIGAITFDKSVGLSHTTGQITHHIDPEVDAERDLLFEDLKKTGRLESMEVIDGFHQMLEGKNGGGDPWRTDGRLFLGKIQSATNAAD